MNDTLKLPVGIDDFKKYVKQVFIMWIKQN